MTAPDPDGFTRHTDRYQSAAVRMPQVERDLAEAQRELSLTVDRSADTIALLHVANGEVERLREALILAESALADIGDAEREPSDSLAWCELRAAEALPDVRAAISRSLKEKS